MIDSRIYWIWLAERAGQGSRVAVSLVNAFGSAKRVYAAEPSDLDGMDSAELSGRELGRAKEILSDKSLDAAEHILEECERLGQRVLVPTDEDFPKSLASLCDAPMVLYSIGKLPNMNRELCVSVVGTRAMSESGRRNAYAIGYGLAAGGAIVVSGMALGCDGMALCGAISAGGRCIAVLGGGADVVYPRDHRSLYDTILHRGAIISEYPPGTRPEGRHFPIRNRIISGLSAGTAVIEADMHSGALITARRAVYQGRNVFAVPGEVGFPGAEGTNNLIKLGAFAVTSAEDILTEYEYLYPHSVSMRSLRRAMRNIELDGASAEAMARLRISSRDSERYYGTGSYGGRRSWFGSSKHRRSRSDDGSVVLGERAERISVAKQKPQTESRDMRGSTECDVAEPMPPKRIELDLLDEINIKVYNMMKVDVPMIPDELVTDDVSVSDVLSSLSMLELAGAVESGAGGYFLRRSSDDISWPSDEE